MHGPLASLTSRPGVVHLLAISTRVGRPLNARSKWRAARVAAGTAPTGVWGKQAAEGRCTTPEWFFFPNGQCMWMVKGERRVLEELVNGDETRRQLTRGNLLLRDLEYMLVDTGSAADRVMGQYAAELGSI